MPQLSPALAGLPVVQSTNDRGLQFPTPAVNQRVHNLQTQAIERYTGTAWSTDFVGGAVVAFGPMQYGGTGDGVADESSAVGLAATAAASLGGSLLLTPAVTYRISQNTTINVPIHFSEGSGGFTVDSGKTLTINGPITAPVDEQVFAGDGSFAFGNGQVVFRPEWFGVITDDGTDAYSDDIPKLAALKILADNNLTAMQKLLNSLPGAGSTDLYQLRRQKTVMFRPTHYTFQGTLTIQNRRITFAPEQPGIRFASVIRVYSNSHDAGGITAVPLFFIAGNPGAAPFYLNVSGEITFAAGLAFESAPHFNSAAVIQVGGKYNGTVYHAQGASPVTGVNIDGCSFGQVYACARFTYCGQCEFNNNLLDGGYYGVQVSHAVQELTIENNRFSGTNFFPLQINAVGATLNYNGDPVPNTRWISFNNNKHSSYAGASYGSQSGGFDGVVQIINDSSNMVYVVEIKNNRCLALGNIQEAFFSETTSALIYADYITDLYIQNNYFDEWSGNTTHWATLLRITGSGSDKVYASNNSWNVTRDATAIAAGTPWYSMPASVVNTNIPNVATVTLANNAIFSFPVAFKHGLLEVEDITSTANAAQFFVATGGTTRVTKIADSSTAPLFTTTKDTASSANVYFDAVGTLQLTLQNKTGGTRSFRCKVSYREPDAGTQ